MDFQIRVRHLPSTLIRAHRGSDKRWKRRRLRWSKPTLIRWWIHAANECACLRTYEDAQQCASSRGVVGVHMGDDVVVAGHEYIRSYSDNFSHHTDLGGHNANYVIHAAVRLL